VNFRERYGPWAVVAGGSEGLGAAFAVALAGRGINPLLIARRQEPLDALAAKIVQSHNIEVRTLAIDLASPGLAALIAEGTRGLDVGLVVASAAEARMAPFVDVALADHLRAVDVNCRAPLTLVHTLLPRLLARGRGGVVIMSSLAALIGGPYVATYAATKAFGCVLAESLAGELGPRGVDVIACVAGPTRTPTYERNAGGALAPMDPARVVDETLAALGRTPRVVAGARNRAARAFISLLPRRWAIPLVAAQTRKLLPQS
jgi:short-subunit dehydrogenase